MSEDNDGSYRLVSFIERAPNRKKILEVLNKNDVYTPTEISDETDLYRQNVSRAITELENENLINCLAPNAHKYRYYEISEKGKQILELLEER